MRGRPPPGLPTPPPPSRSQPALRPAPSAWRPAARPSRRSRGRRGWIVLALVLVTLLAAAALGLRYGPLIDEVRGVRDTAQRLAAEARSLEPADLEVTRLASLRSGILALEGHLAPLRETLTHDPLVGLARGLPVAGEQLRAADALVEATGSIADAGQRALGLAERVARLREQGAAESGGMLPGLVEIVATSGQEVDVIAALLEGALARLDTIPATATGQVREARDLAAGPLRAYLPLLDAYRELDDVLPAMLGRGGQRRYLILAQNPAELRPAGGYSGTVGVLALEDGRVVEQRFTDVHKLDEQSGLPFVEPPAPLRDHLLGEDQSWRLADAAWTADFPAAARQALEFYELETGDREVDGVIAVTTFALDRILEVIGPVDIEEFDVTVAAGETTLILLGETRGPQRSPENRKDILDALARVAMARLLALPPERWPALLEALRDIGEQRMAMAWFSDEAAQGLATSSGWSGALRAGAGDYVYVVEANMAPTSKYNLVVDRSDSLVVKLDEEGEALSSLRLDWRNEAGRPGEPYASLREYSNNTEGWYGAHVRVVVPAGAELVTASGETPDPVRGAERLDDEAGLTAFGNYLFMPPGEAMMSYLWTTPGAAQRIDAVWEYRLVVQRQPGARPHPLSVRVDLPAGARLVDAPAGAAVESGRVTLRTTLVTDVELLVRYALATESPA